MEEKRKRGRPKGTAKTGGRKAGTPNKVSTEAKELIRQAIDLKVFKRRLNSIKSDAQYCAIVLKLLEFVVPKLKSIEVTGDDNKPLVIELPSRISVEDIKAILDDE